MKIFLLHSLVPGVRYYRLTSPARYLSKELGHDVYLESTPMGGLEQSNWQERAKDDNDVFSDMLENMLPGMDLLVTQLVHSDIGIAVLHAIREKYGIPIVVDIDDNVISVPHYNRGGIAYQPNTDLLDITIELLKFADAVTTTTQYLKDLYSEHNKNIYVLPNAIDFEHWDVEVEVPPKRSIRIGWMGAQTHEDDFKLMLPAVKEVLRKYPNVRFYFIGGVPDCVAAIKSKRVVTKTTWYSILDYPKRLKQWNWDIGLAPLRDNAFNRGKSNLRWLEYSAMGIPCVAARVEPFVKSVADGKTGLLAYEPEEWVAQMSRLIEDEGLRRKMGVAAKREVRKNFNIKKNVRLWESAYTAIIKQRSEAKVDGSL